MNNKVAMNTYLLTTDSKKKIKNKKPAEQKHNHRNRECFDGCQMRGGLGGWV